MTILYSESCREFQEEQDGHKKKKVNAHFCKVLDILALGLSGLDFICPCLSPEA